MNILRWLKKLFCDCEPVRVTATEYYGCPQPYLEYRPLYFKCTKCGRKWKQDTPQSLEPWRDW